MVHSRRGIGQGEEAGGLRAGQGTDHRPVSFAEALDAGGPEGDGFDRGVQTDIESVGEDVGEVIIALQTRKSAGRKGWDDLIVLVENGRDDGAKLAQAGEEFLFEFARLRGEVLDAKVHEVPCQSCVAHRPPATEDRSKTRTPTPAAWRAWAQTEPGKACSDNRDGAGFFTRAM